MKKGSRTIDLVRQRGVFTLGLLSPFERRNAENGQFLAHKKILKPLLEVASEGWVYDLKPSDETYGIFSKYLKRSQGKHRFLLGSNLVDGYESFWNATGGKRGTVVLLVPKEKFDGKNIFPHCHSVSVTVNFGAAHTPAAIRFARGKVRSGKLLAFCFSRNNGFEWIDLLMRPAEAQGVFETAMKSSLPGRLKWWFGMY